MNGGRPASGRLLVIGAGIAGMCAASALRPFFAEVVLLEKDDAVDGEVHRRGIPQAHFVHSLLERGRLEFEALFPGFTDRLRARGVPLLDFGLDVAALRASGWMPRHSCGIETFWPSRPLVDATLRQLLGTLDGVEVRSGVRVVGLDLTEGPRPAIRGVHLDTRDGPAILSADLVVDAGGRGTALPKWLRAAGIEAPPEEIVDAKAGYSARLYRAPERSRLPPAWWWSGIVAECAPPEILTGGVLFPTEDGRWLVTLMGFNGEYPPTGEHEFASFAANLRTPLIAEAIRRAEPVSPIFGTRALQNRFRRFERWRDPVSGLIVLGDAVCAMNPIYGQGMSLSAAAASLLRQCAGEIDPRQPEFASTFLKRQAALLAAPWEMSTASDFAYPGTIGVQRAFSALRSRYLNALFEAAWRDPALHRRLVRVIHLLDHPRQLYSPAIAGRAVAGLLKRRASGRGGHTETIAARNSYPPVGASAVR